MNTELRIKLQKLYESAANIIAGLDKGFDSVNTISNGANILVEHMDELKIYPSVYTVLTRCINYVNKDFDEGTTFQDYVDMGDQLIDDISGTLGEFLDKEDGYYELIEETANKSVSELKEMYLAADLAETKFREGARQFFSRNLSGKYDEEHPKECDITLEYGYFGMSSLEMPNIDKMYMDEEGVIWFYIIGFGWEEIDNLSIHHQMNIIENFD